MVKTQPTVDFDGKYQITDTANALGVHVSTVDRWTRSGIMTCTVRRANGRRVWSGKEIVRVWRAMY